MIWRWVAFCGQFAVGRVKSDQIEASAAKSSTFSAKLANVEATFQLANTNDMDIIILQKRQVVKELREEKISKTTRTSEDV